MTDSAIARREAREAMLDGLARAIRGPRLVVARAFEETFAGKGGVISLEAIAGAVANDTEAYSRALRRADREGWLKAFCVQLMQADAVADRRIFAERARELFGDTVDVTQATFDPYNTSYDPSVDGMRKRQAAPQLCRIDIDGKAAGTGFLVRAHLVLTCYHVVAPLIDTGTERDGSHQRLSIVFDDRRDLRGSAVTLLPGVPIGVPKKWLVDSSHCLPIEELGVASDDDTYADEIDAVKGPWDYALIRLEKIVSPAYKGLPLGMLGISNEEAITVYHHPRGKPLVGTPGKVASLLGQGVRFKHTVNTKDGSSGGPCFNSEYDVVGIHQAGRRAFLGSKHPVPNRAVPIHPIRVQIMAMLQDPPPEMKTILALDTGHIVIGRDDTQQWIWRAVPKEPALPPGLLDRILVVKGAEGRGKKFTLDIMRTLLAGGAHMLTDLDAGNMVEDTPLTFARKVLVAFNADVGGLPTNESLTTDLNWLKTKLMPKILAAIDGIRGGRTVWIGVRYPRDGVLPEGSKIRDALDAFYVQVKEVDWLRLVLLDLRVDVPDDVRNDTTTETLKPLSVAEVVTYFERRWTELGVAADKAALEVFAETIVQAEWGIEEFPAAHYHRKLVASIRNKELKLVAKLR
jgi:hypothetical protein